MREAQKVLARLRRSPFRGRIRLQRKEIDYLKSKGLEEILGHAVEFIEKRLAPAEPPNDGKQTPWRNHPVFVAQHATATCCRNCLQKWHDIPKGRTLTEEEKRYIVEVIQGWLSQTTSVNVGEDCYSAADDLAADKTQPSPMASSDFYSDRRHRA